ncbi:hypothetical protein B0H13DRAFT_2283670 [Mycena leptocephala]|nr:hypothetical protein B0H13DRAFT_2283670 [Mycena leptocephala]
MLADFIPLASILCFVSPRNCTTFSLILNGWGPLRALPHSKIPASRPTLQSPKHRPPAHDANIFYCFRKPRSKLGPHCPAQTFDVHAPIPRTTSDSTTISTYFHAPVLVLGASAPRCTGRSVDARHHHRGQAGGARDEVAQRRAVESARGRSEVDIIGGRSAAAVPALSARGAGFGLARNERTGLIRPDPCLRYRLGVLQSNVKPADYSLFSIFSSMSPAITSIYQTRVRALYQGCLPLRVEMPSRLHPHPEQLVNLLYSILQTSRRRPFDRDRLARDCYFMSVPTYIPSCPGFPEHIAAALHHPPPSARPHRLAVPPNGFPSLPPPPPSTNVDFVDGSPARPAR